MPWFGGGFCRTWPREQEKKGRKFRGPARNLSYCHVPTEFVMAYFAVVTNVSVHEGLAIEHAVHVAIIAVW